MKRWEFRFEDVDPLGHLTANSGNPTPHRRFSFEEAERARESLLPITETDSAVPGWDDLWVDLGGEG